jgi:hypothetical protein
MDSWSGRCQPTGGDEELKRTGGLYGPHLSPLRSYSVRRRCSFVVRVPAGASLFIVRSPAVIRRPAAVRRPYIVVHRWRRRCFHRGHVRRIGARTPGRGGSASPLSGKQRKRDVPPLARAPRLLTPRLSRLCDFSSYDSCVGGGRSWSLIIRGSLLFVRRNSSAFVFVVYRPWVCRPCCVAHPWCLSLGGGGGGWRGDASH